MIGEAVLVALITGACAIIAQMLIAKQSAKDLYAKLERQSEVSDVKIEAKIQKYQAVTDSKLEELTREVREHNNFARRMPVIEEKVSNLEKKVGNNV